MSSSKPAESSSTAIAVVVACVALLLLVGGGAAFFLMRRVRAERELAMVHQVRAIEAEHAARLRAEAGGVAAAEPDRADDAESTSALGQVLHERFARRTGEPARAAEEMAEIAQALSTAIATRRCP